MNAVDPASFDVEDDGSRRRYVKIMPNGETARLTFVRAAPDGVDAPGSREHWIADSTFVPVPYRGDGVAEALVERLIADARVEGATITPTCGYVADEFERHGTEWDDVRAG